MDAEEIKKIINGLKENQAYMPTRFLYDSLGGVLFEAITELPQYNATRDEVELYDTKMKVIADKLPNNPCLVDLGAGSCRKAAYIIPILKPTQYVAVDLPSEFFSQSVLNLEKKFPNISINSLEVDFSSNFCSDLVRNIQGTSEKKQPLVYFYPGSTIGNFSPEVSINFLKSLNADGILIGIDLIKPLENLIDAYDDNLGVTSAFNKNCLLHFNRIANTNFDVSNWKHEARFNERESRIEMHLRSYKDQTVESPHGQIFFKKNQTIHTENSYKYTVSSFSTLLNKAGFTDLNSFVHPTNRYALFTGIKSP